VYVARADGAAVRAVAVIKDAVLSVSWSSRGDIAVGSLPYVDGSPRAGKIEVIDDEGRVLRVFKPPSRGCRWTEPGDLDWSPDGRVLVFGAAANGCPPGVFVLNAKSGRSRRLTLELPWRHRPKSAPRYLPWASRSSRRMGARC